MHELENMKESNRDNSIDFLRGIAVALVLWGHSIQYLSGNSDFFENPLFVIIYSFHMPLFMFLSGYVFFWSCSKKTLMQILCSRLRGVGVPMLTWGLIFSGLSWGSNYPHSFIEVIETYFNKCIGIWFLWSVLLSSALVAITHQFTKKTSNLFRYGIMLLTSLVFVILPGSLYNLFVYPFFILGFAFCEYGLLYSIKMKKYQILSVPIWIVMLFFYKKRDFIYISGFSLAKSEYGIWGQLKIDLFRYLIGCFGIFASVFLITLLYKWIKLQYIIEFVNYVGRHSLDIYLLQRTLLEFLIFRIFNRLGIIYLSSNLLIFDLVITPMCMLVCLGVLFYISKAIERSAFLTFILFGRLNKDKGINR